ncbi:MAG: threonylcarbamoyl-AMP synthase [Verrucomicrobia bacterium]|nr:threonylcarbamoyl-AMP synthase [Verrucomicrobiota bacterium]
MEDRQSTAVMSPVRNIAEILPTHTAALFDAAVKRAAELLRTGEVVALPTETVYGLAANALDAAAVARIFAVKGRPAHNPIIIHVCDLAMARRFAGKWPETAEKLARSFWPGPLTLVLPRTKEIPDIVTAGGSTVGVRWPSHPFMQAVIRECGFPLAAPSANPSNFLSPTNAQHVQSTLGDRIKLIVDGGQSQVGIESTVVDVTTTPPALLRPGMIHVESLAAALGETGLRSANSTSGETLKSPGQLKKHYSPNARLRILSWKDDTDLRRQLIALGAEVSRTQVVVYSAIPALPGLGGVSVIPHDAEAYARALYAELHRCDNEGAEWIVVESLPEGPEWQAIGDRLRRAAS